MRLILLLFFSFISFQLLAQNSSLPAGRYETILKQTQSKWHQGDIILVDNNHYKISSSDEVGEYKYSATAQRVIFISGPLKMAFAKTVLNASKPAIILPVAENEQQGLKFAGTDIIAYLKN